MNLSRAFILLRFPLAFWYLPIWLFAIALSYAYNPEALIHSFVGLFIFIFPAQHGYRAAFHIGNGSLPGLKQPAKGGWLTFFIALIFSLLGLGILLLNSPEQALLASATVVLGILLEIPPFRLRSIPIIGSIVKAVAFGANPYLITFLFCQDIPWDQAIQLPNALAPAGICAGIAVAFIPLTQLFTITKGKKEMNTTAFLGVKGSFEFCLIIWVAASALMGYHFIAHEQSHLFYLYLCFAFPPLSFLAWWMVKIWDEPQMANYRYGMMLLRIALGSAIVYTGVLIALKIIPIIFAFTPY